MKISELISGYRCEMFGDSDCEVSSITYDSRAVTAGTVFAAVQGFATDGHRFIDSAIAHGAVAVMSEKSPERTDISWIKVDSIRASLADLSARLYNVDPLSLRWIGVTGTNGKTTVVTLLDQIMAEQFGRAVCWQFGTIGNRLGLKFEEASRTTPEAVDLLRMIGTADHKPTLISMEVSSHALELERVRGFCYDVAIFTNLTQDHLDFHGDMENYYLAKKKLFTDHLKADGSAIINIDDAYGKRLASELNDDRVITVGRDSDAFFHITTSHCSWDKTFLRVTFGENRYVFESKLVGHFNVANMAVVAAASIAIGVPYETIDTVFKQIEPVNGRMDRVKLDAPFAVVIDYAHTPDAIKNTLFTAKKLTSGRVICVFGAGGDRDKTKRPIMGELAAKNSDYVIVTSDNPRSENPSDIIADIIDGIPTDFPIRVIENRREAIIAALKFAREGDSIIVAGKGHETYQEENGVKEHFDDREVVIEEWTKMQEIK